MVVRVLTSSFSFNSVYNIQAHIGVINIIVTIIKIKSNKSCSFWYNRIDCIIEVLWHWIQNLTLDESLLWIHEELCDHWKKNKNINDKHMKNSLLRRIKIRNRHHVAKNTFTFRTNLSMSSRLHSTCSQYHKHSGSQDSLIHVLQCTTDHSHHYLCHWHMDWVLKINCIIYPFCM